MQIYTHQACCVSCRCRELACTELGVFELLECFLILLFLINKEINIIVDMSANIIILRKCRNSQNLQEIMFLGD